VARLNTDGSLDGTFNPVGTGSNGSLQVLTIDASGKIIVGGAFTSYNGTTEPHVARLSSSKILVGGTFASYNGTPAIYIARLNPGGSLDNTFAPVGTGLSNALSALVLSYTLE
jgi:hypothetical protein